MRRFVFPAMAVVALAVLASVLIAGLDYGEGKVVSTETGLPIAGVEVQFECEKGKLHGSELVRVATSVTGADGIYRFGWSDIRGCDRGVLRVKRHGYVGFPPSEIIWRSVAGHVFHMAPEEEAVMRTMKFWLSATQPAGSLRSHPTPKAEYEYVYFRFLNSRNVARTPREKSFVVESYCARLLGLYGKLTPPERDELRSKKEMITTRSPARWETIDHEGQVAVACLPDKGGG
jgi:hypothetical protein